MANIISKDIDKSLISTNEAPLDKRTLYQTKADFLGAYENEYIEITNPATGATTIRTKRFIGQKVVIQADPENNGKPKEYWFRDGITDADLVKYDSYEWENLEPGTGSGGGGGGAVVVDTDVVKDLTISYNSTTLSALITTKNLRDGSERIESRPVNVAGSNNGAGVMDMAMFNLLQSLNNRVSELETQISGQPRRAIVSTLSATPSQNDIQTAFINSFPGTTPNVGDMVSDIVNNKLYTYDNSLTWQVSNAQQNADLASQSHDGLVKHSGTIGEVGYFTPGVGQVNGWDALNSEVTTAKQTANNAYNEALKRMLPPNLFNSSDKSVYSVADFSLLPFRTTSDYSIYLNFSYTSLGRSASDFVLGTFVFDPASRIVGIVVNVGASSCAIMPLSLDVAKTSNLYITLPNGTFTTTTNGTTVNVPMSSFPGTINFPIGTNTPNPVVGTLVCTADGYFGVVTNVTTTQATVKLLSVPSTIYSEIQYINFGNSGTDTSDTMYVNNAVSMTVSPTEGVSGISHTANYFGINMNSARFKSAKKLYFMFTSASYAYVRMYNLLIGGIDGGGMDEKFIGCNQFGAYIALSGGNSISGLKYAYFQKYGLSGCKYYAVGDRASIQWASSNLNLQINRWEL